MACALADDRHPTSHFNPDIRRAMTAFQPGECVALDGAYLFFASDWGRYTHILVFVCLASMARLVYFTRSTNATEFLAAVDWVRSYFKLKCNVALKRIYCDAFSTYLSVHRTAPYRLEHGIDLHAYPPHLHYLNHLAERTIHSIQIGCRIRLRQLIGQVSKGKTLRDPRRFFPWAAVHTIQCANLLPSAPLERIYQAYVSPEQILSRQTNVALPQRMRPFGAVGYLLLEPSERDKFGPARRPYWYLSNADLSNPLVSNLVDHSSADVVLNPENGHIRLSAKIHYPYEFVSALRTAELSPPSPPPTPAPHEDPPHSETLPAPPEHPIPHLPPTPTFDVRLRRHSVPRDSVPATRHPTAASPPAPSHGPSVDPPATPGGPSGPAIPGEPSSDLPSDGPSPSAPSPDPPTPVSSRSLIPSHSLPSLSALFDLPDLALRPGSAKPHQRRKNAAGVQRRLAATSTGEYRAAGGSLADFKYDLQHDYLQFVRPPRSILEPSSFLATALADGGEMFR